MVLFTAQVLTQYCNEGTLNEKLQYIGNKLRNQALRLQPVTCTVIDTGVRDENNHTPAEGANSYNITQLEYFKKLPRFFTKFLSTEDKFSNNIVHDHAELSDFDRALDLQIINPDELSLLFDRKKCRQCQQYDGVNVGFYMKMIQLFSQPVYLNDENGLQQLLNDVSVRNEIISTNDGNKTIDLLPHQARDQIKEISHTHHEPLGKDINPTNTEYESRRDNLARKRCAAHPDLCQCPTPCHDRIATMTRELFDTLVLEYVVQPFGKYGDKRESVIREDLADTYVEWLQSKGIEQTDQRFPQFLKEEERGVLLECQYEQYEGMRGYDKFARYVPGVWNQRLRRKVTFDDMLMDHSTIPNTINAIIGEIKDQAVSLRPVITKLRLGGKDALKSQGESDARKQVRLTACNSTVRTENERTARRSMITPIILEHCMNDIKPNHRDSVDEEKDIGALHVHSMAICSRKGQIFKFTRGSTWTDQNRYFVNQWARGRDLNAVHHTVPRTIKQGEFIVNNWQNSAFDGDENETRLYKLTRHLSILGLPEENDEGGDEGGDETIDPVLCIDSHLAMCQAIEASHKHHQDLSSLTSERKIATDARPAHMILESRPDNQRRTICSMKPWLPSSGRCMCSGVESEKCAPVLHKLTEKRLVEHTDSQFLSARGRYVGETPVTKRSIEEDLVRKFRNAFEHNNEEVPDWLKLREQQGDGETTRNVYRCDVCQRLHLFMDDVLSCNHGNPPQMEEDQGDDKDEITNVSDWTDIRFLELHDAILYHGLVRVGMKSKYEFIGENMSTCKASKFIVKNQVAKKGNNTSSFEHWVRETYYGDNDNAARLGDNYMTQLRKCRGSTRACECPLHT